MSKEGVKKVIGRLLMDDDFKSSLLSKPESTLSEFDLSKEEIDALKKISDKDIEAMEINVEALAEAVEKGPKIGIYICH